MSLLRQEGRDASTDARQGEKPQKDDVRHFSEDKVEKEPMHQAKAAARIFLCHAKEDKPRVREVYQRLKAEGLQPWFDDEDLLPGQL